MADNNDKGGKHRENDGDGKKPWDPKKIARPEDKKGRHDK